MDDKICCICLEKNLYDILLCGHIVHKLCVKNWADKQQEYLIKHGYPALRYALCPLCKTEQTDIIPKISKWYGTIEIKKTTMQNILQLLKINNGYIPKDSIPREIIEEMPNADVTEQTLFVNVAATLLWASNHTIEPELLKLTQIKGGAFKSHFKF